MAVAYTDITSLFWWAAHSEVTPSGVVRTTAVVDTGLLVWMVLGRYGGTTPPTPPAPAPSPPPVLDSLSNIVPNRAELGLASAVVGTEVIYSEPSEFDPEEFRAMLRVHPNSEYIRWKQALLNPAYDTRTGTSNSTNLSKWIWNEVDVSRFTAMIRGLKIARQYFPFGDLKDGDIMVTVMIDEIPIDDHDLVIPMGRISATPSGRPDYRTIQQKQILVRGNSVTKGPGTVSSFSESVIGTGTMFL